MTENALAQLTIVIAFAVTAWRMRRTLPAQNIVAVLALIILLSAGIEALGAKVGVPFGPFFYTDNLGQSVFHLPPWPIPLLWAVILMNSRGVARLILKPWRSAANYGLWSIALSCVLTVFLDFALEPFATRANRWWIWTPARVHPFWYGAPWVNFAGWLTVSLLILGIVTPWLIIKKPIEEPPPDPVPLGVWIILMLLLAIGNAMHHLWDGTIFAVAACGIVAILAMRNAKIWAATQHRPTK